MNLFRTKPVESSRRSRCRERRSIR
jgi:hypothetical protein